MIKSQQYSQLLEKLFNSEVDSMKIDLNILKQICKSQDYRRLIDVTTILFKIFSAGRQHLSIRDILKQSIYPSLNESKKELINKQNKIQFFIDGLNVQQLTIMIKELQQVRLKLKYTIYSIKLLQIIQMLRRALGQLKNLQKRQDIINLGDFQIMQQQYKKYLAVSIFHSNFQSKLSQFLKNPQLFLQCKFKNSSTMIKFIAVQIIPNLQKSILSIQLTSHTQRQGQLSRVLNFINNHFIAQYQLEVEISKNTLVETRVYNNKFQRQLLFRYRITIVKAIKKIINQAILCPSSMNIQILLFRILRRLYYLWDYSNVHSSQYLQNIQQYQNQQIGVTNIVRNPLFLAIRNIALFSDGRQQQIKQAAMFTYKVVNDKNDLQLISLFQNSEEIRFLKSSKFYSSKAYIYSDEIEKTYEPLQLGNLYLKNYQIISSRDIWVYTFLVERPSSLINWQFYLTSYDIRFGIFKVQHLRQMQLQQYEKGIDCRQILKFQKIQNTVNNPNRGHLYLKNGVYRFIFDNTFSMIRSKQICYSFLHLETNN